MEIHYARQLGSGAGAAGDGVRLCCRLQKQSAAAAKLQLVAPDDGGASVRSQADPDRICIRTAWLRHESGPGADAHLAAGCPQRSTLADQRDALGRVA